MNPRSLSAALLLAAVVSHAEVAVSTAPPAVAAPAAPAVPAVPAPAPEASSPAAVLVPAPEAASAEPCARDWKAFTAEQGSGTPGDAPARLDKLGDAWVEAFACGVKKTFASSCGQAEKARKSACKQAGRAYDAGLDKLDIVSESAESQADRLSEGLPIEDADLSGDYWATPDAEHFGGGLSRLTRWYHKELGAAAQSKLEHLQTINKQIMDLANDLDAADQLGFTKAQRKEKKRSLADLEKQADSLKGGGAKEGKKMAKQARGQLKTFTARLKKDLKARAAAKDLCSCP